MNLLSAVLSLAWLTSVAYADCQSFGTDFQDGGTYCIDPRIVDVFTFGTDWFGCTPADTQGGITPYISNPDGDGQFCSLIQTNPDGTEMISVCNVDGEPLTKDYMYSGNWTIGLYGLTFAYQREFYLNVAIPETVFSTPTVSITSTLQPVKTWISLAIFTESETLEPRTVTAPSATRVFTATVTPADVTTVSTMIYYSTVWVQTFSQTTVVATSTCTGDQPYRMVDAVATFTPAAVRESQWSADYNNNNNNNNNYDDDGNNYNDGYGEQGDGNYWHVRREILEKRAPDPCMITSVADDTEYVTVTTTAPTSTITIPNPVTVTATITPPPVTSFVGGADETITLTLPTGTITYMEYYTSTTTLVDVSEATYTSTIVTAPPGRRCRSPGFFDPFFGPNGPFGPFRQGGPFFGPNSPFGQIGPFGGSRGGSSSSGSGSFGSGRQSQWKD